jgi:hypothetical protein
MPSRLLSWLRMQAPANARPLGFAFGVSVS